MDIKFLLTLYRKNRFSKERKFSFNQLFSYFILLKIGELTGKIYTKKNCKNESVDITYLQKSEEILDSCIRETLSNIKIKSKIDLNNKIGFENIGFGCFITPAMFGESILMTQNIATLYFSSITGKQATLKLKFLSIPKISGDIIFENEKIKHFSIQSLGSYEDKIIINSKNVKEKISKISILVDRCWTPNFLDRTLPNFPVGVGIEQIEMIQ